MLRTSPITLRVILQTLGALLLLAVIFLYVLWQARYLISGPQIILASQPLVVHNERTVLLEGSTFNISRLWLNDRQIFTNPDGDFKEVLVLENGYTISTLRAEDRYGRSRVITQPFFYLPASTLN